MKYRIDQISGVRFGTSGARGLDSDFTDLVSYLYVIGFLQYARKKGASLPGPVAIAGDLRPSTPRIMQAVCKAITDFGAEVLDCGKIPTPTLALYGFTRKIPSLMITGSHVPGKRNGLKFFLHDGEILKVDEEEIRKETVEAPEKLFDSRGMFLPEIAREISNRKWKSAEGDAKKNYIDRFLKASPQEPLQGFRIGFYEHSAVGRDLLCELYTLLGAKVTKLGRCEEFQAIDSEALSEKLIHQVREWSLASPDSPILRDPLNPRFDVILSTDADSDRPLLFDEHGQWIRGDILGILTARYLGADCVCTPVSTSTALERCKWFKKIVRTKIGSPYVAGAMRKAVEEGYRNVVGFEPNGGFLTAQDMMVDERVVAPLSALMSRDPATVHISVICMAKEQGVPVSSLLEHIPRRIVLSDRIQDFPSLFSQQKLEELILGGRDMMELVFGAFGELSTFDTMDGLRMSFGENDIVHLRPSGNAPEFRCYCETDTKQRAEQLLEKTLEIVSSWKKR